MKTFYLNLLLTVLLCGGVHAFSPGTNTSGLTRETIYTSEWAKAFNTNRDGATATAYMLEDTNAVWVLARILQITNGDIIINFDTNLYYTKAEIISTNLLQSNKLSLNLIQTNNILAANNAANTANLTTVSNQAAYATNAIAGTNIALTGNISALSNVAGILNQPRLWTALQSYDAGLISQEPVQVVPVPVANVYNWTFDWRSVAAADATPAHGAMAVSNGLVSVSGAVGKFVASGQDLDTNARSKSLSVYESNYVGYIEHTLNTHVTGPNYALKVATNDLSWVETSVGADNTNVAGTFGKYGDGRLYEFYGRFIAKDIVTGTSKTIVVSNGVITLL